ncbi:MAG: NADH-quinone oxidoreductase subunit NuoH [Chloroflexi bacterium]|nr:NADH-quinone oxidoreductase subunit NuoH [Chloroflexota bacterium]
MYYASKLLKDAGLSDGLANTLGIYISVLLLATVFLLLPIFTIWVERKVAARFQNRVGPNRVGPFGILQSIPDVVKLLSKELIFPRNVDRIPYMISPVLMVVSVIMMVAVVPLAPNIIGTDLSIGALYFVAISSLSTIGVVMAGWGSNNKYALLGAFRTVAQLISYEIPMVFTLLVPVMLAGTMSMQKIVDFQGDNYWIFFYAPTAFIIFILSNLGEVGRSPFDLIEAESELVAGFMIEYSAMAFAMFYLAEFLHAFLIGVFAATLFMGGWQGPFVQDLPVLGILYLSAKAFFIYFLTMWIRLTLPRFRIDQMMAFNWKFLVPVSIVHLLITGFLWKVLPEPEVTGNIFDRLFNGEALLRVGVMFLLSALVFVFSLRMLRNAILRGREATSAKLREAYPAAHAAAAPAGD